MTTSNPSKLDERIVSSVSSSDASPRVGMTIDNLKLASGANKSDSLI